ncbi:MAG TPA: hypothetical protein VJ890_11835, partial [Vineibacter sp.]|nr:hypothetical protein [Vineibacter sp.]
MHRNPYSSAEIDRASHQREDDDQIEDLLVGSKTKFVPIDNERNLIDKKGQPQPVFLHGMMARALIRGGAPTIFLGHTEGET